MHLVKDKMLAKNMKTKGLEPMRNLKSTLIPGARTQQNNPQMVLEYLKKDWMALARARGKSSSTETPPGNTNDGG